MLKKETEVQKKSEGQHEEKSLKESFDEIQKKETLNATPEIKKDLSNAELKELIEKNIKWSQVIYNQNRKINHRLTWMTIGSYLRLALIVVPLILGIIYLPPLIMEFLENYGAAFGIDSDTFSQFGELFKNMQTSSGQMDQSQIQDLIKQYQQYQQ
ncbi:MAG: hypothetical protein HYV41_05595 [Candidatus Magasanikbacteria bacterium]|nr:hypothetical protein [Candidatus Magasanikbacteria bacterium]